MITPKALIESALIPHVCTRGLCGEREDHKTLFEIPSAVFIEACAISANEKGIKEGSDIGKGIPPF